MPMVNSVTKMTDRIYRITELGSIHRYLVLGNEKALLIDTGYGFEDIRPMIREITSLPLLVANTHGHSDHCFGNYYFTEAYLNPKDLPGLLAGYTREAKEKIIEYRIRKNPWFKDVLDQDAYFAQNLNHVTHLPLVENDVLDLGGVTLRAIEVPGHSVGSVALYSPELRSLFGGDSVNSHPIWYVGSFDQTLPLSVFLQSLRRLQGMNLDFDAIYPGHGNSPIGPEVLDQLIGCILDLNQRDEGDEPIENSGMVGRQHRFENVCIIYSRSISRRCRDSLR